MSKEQRDKVKIIEGSLDGKNLCVRIVASKFNREIVEGLLDGALKALSDHGVRNENVHVVWVPGAFEIPLALRREPRSLHGEKYRMQIALGCVIRGETAHFDQVVSHCSRGVMGAMIALNAPIGYGVLAVDNIEQARARSGEALNRGEEAALAALEMVSVLNKAGDYRLFERG